MLTALLLWFMTQAAQPSPPSPLPPKQYEITIDAAKQEEGPARGRGPFPGSPTPGHSQGLPISLELQVPSTRFQSNGKIGIDFIITNIGAEPIQIPFRLKGPENLKTFYEKTKILTLWFTSDAIQGAFLIGPNNTKIKIESVPLSAQLYGWIDDPTSFYTLAPSKSIRVHTSSPALDPGTYPLTAHAELIRLVAANGGWESELVGTADAEPITKVLKVPGGKP